MAVQVIQHHPHTAHHPPQDTPRPPATASATQSPLPSDAPSHAPNADAATAQKPFTHPAPFVSIVLPTRPPRRRRQRRVNSCHHRIGTLIKTNHRTLWGIRLGIHLQHRLLSPNQVRRHLRQTPLLLLPRLERVCFCVQRTVSSEIVATTPNSISSSASNCIVPHSRPSGGALQASAIRNASCLVSSLRWAPGRGRSVRAACSPSSAKRLRMLRTVCGLSLRASAMAGSVLLSSERRRMRARVRVRALACPLRSRVLRSLRSSSFSRTT